MDVTAAYLATTDLVAELLGGSRQLAHIHAGLAIYVAVQILTRDRRASLHGLMAVAGAELANEIVEAAHYGSPRWADTLADIGLTCLWPLILFAVSLHRRRRWAAWQARLNTAALDAFGPMPVRARPVRVPTIRPRTARP